MNRLLMFLIIGASLSGCATKQPESLWGEISVEVSPAAAALDCGPLPFPTLATGVEIVYDEAGVNALEEYRLCSEANQANVDEHAAQLMQLKVARRALVDAGQAQRNIADMRLEMLNDERQHHFWQSIGYWAVIIGLGLAI